MHTTEWLRSADGLPVPAASPANIHMMSQQPLNLVVLISGTGSNLQALIDAVPSFQTPAARISLVVSNSKFAYGIERAQAAQPPIPTKVHSLAAFRKQNPHLTDEAEVRSRYDLELAAVIKTGRPHLVVLAGFMHILSEPFLKEMRSDWNSSNPSTPIPIINLHPALPGQFDGANAIERAWEAGPAGRQEVTETGVMIHEVIAEVDRGAPILTRTVELKKDESLDGLKQRMHDVEHELIVAGTFEMLRRIASSPSIQLS
ncbi:phosphoribosylglycinamide formyltransferase [Puccinia triticina 1-1 BBBD Race 1]|uniref:Phosphoribosylglycinamide formyltransferase n=2 Tax=Puccinia triticina TaxID=208348 RepID=A0A180GN23_PUCT1|nr:uncharacterized protein PtA15_1A936 [Puccinia triticina]OAV94075.1 phosphoribosylglycinamide formyltransferase [Puccinia triticina 1-1 BBBD Race 1]WAQ81594.1 hypothetical protein PtA15_1A936 [Puccinia triticina]WAR52479.1 hypothetical protein PtB15_1B921 [Puccinia triticina]